MPPPWRSVCGMGCVRNARRGCVGAELVVDTVSCTCRVTESALASRLQRVPTQGYAVAQLEGNGS